MSRFSSLWKNRNNLVPFLSAAWPTFSQFGEDLALFNLLNPSHRGTYVDVGANDPFKGSNTAFLYMRGWSGLVIEPNPSFVEAYRKRRPRDTFVTAGVSDTCHALKYFEFKEDVFNTFSPERAEQLRNDGNPPLREQMVPCSPLGDLVAAHLPGRQIDLLSVDCEGLDLQVLESARLDRLRPVAVIVEDFDQYTGFRDGKPRARMEEYLRSQAYSPIYQCAWSSIYVFDEWRTLKSKGFNPPEALEAYMPKPRALR